MGAWIETAAEELATDTITASLPIWERGLKLTKWGRRLFFNAVAPYMGAWIETAFRLSDICQTAVAPYMGAWIETKLYYKWSSMKSVAPYMGAWIETA